MTTLSFRAGEIYVVYGVFFTAHSRYTGYVYTRQFRFSDMMNDLEQEFIRLHNATFQRLYAARQEEIHAGSVVLNRNQIILAMPRDIPASEPPPDRAQMVVERERVPAFLEAWPFTLEGLIHRVPGTGLIDYIHDPQRRFLPVTNCTVTYHLNPDLSFQSPFLLVHRQHIETLVEASSLGRREPVRPTEVLREAEEREFDPAAVAAFLAATPMFRSVNPDALTAACEGLSKRGLMGRRLYRAGTTVFTAGGRGDILYIVEAGRLVAFVSDPAGREHHLGSFGPGDAFGEMAILGDNLRTFSVRAVENSVLVTVHQDAVRELVKQFPSLVTGLINVLIQRHARLTEARRKVPGT